MLREYDGAFEGDFLREGDDTGMVREDMVIRSVMIRLENVLRLPTKITCPSTK